MLQVCDSALFSVCTWHQNQHLLLPTPIHKPYPSLQWELDSWHGRALASPPVAGA